MASASTSGYGEIYGLAGESSSGKTTLIKTIAGAIKPPLEVVDGTIEFAFLPGYGGLHRAPPAEVARIRWRHLSYIMQGSMNVLNPVRRLRSTFADFARPHIDGTEREFEADRRRPPGAGQARRFGAGGLSA